MSEDKTRVLFIVPTLRRAGAETQLIDLANGLPASRYTKTLVVFEGNIDQIDRVDLGNIDFHHLIRERRVDRKMIRRLAELIDENQVDVVHCTLQISMFLARLAIRQSVRQPAIVTAIHTTVNVSLRNELFDRFVYARQLRQSNRVIFVCEAQADHWCGKYRGLDAISKVVYNGVDTQRFDPVQYKDAGISLREENRVPDNAVVISCIAGFRAEKGHSILIEAFAQLPSNCFLLLAGDGPLKENMEERVRSAGLEDRVRFLGNLADVRPLLSGSNLSVLASTAVETFSIAMLESMSMEVPCVVTDIGGLREAISHGESGYLVQPGSSHAMYEALSSATSDVQVLQEMGRAARRKAIKAFSIPMMVSKTSEVLTSVIPTMRSDRRE